MKKLVLYYFPECPYCQIVLDALKDTGLDKFVTYLNTREKPSDREYLIQVTGRATVPCLFIDNRPMHESRDIAQWLKNYAKELSQNGDI
jgi:glutaredoxin 3